MEAHKGCAGKQSYQADNKEHIDGNVPLQVQSQDEDDPRDGGMGADPVDAAGRLRVVQQLAPAAQVLAVAGRIAVGVARQVYVGHRILPHQLEHLQAGRAAGPVHSADQGRVVAVGQLDCIEDEVKDRDEAIHEGACYDTAQMLGDHELDRVPKP